ncbi:MAG TPA: cytochrome b/b6 domain-containing protein [Dongiaceae bacterium]|nr:cytochrome b/b6 domain-containing protein [Dongiaceae bacterium]
MSEETEPLVDVPMWDLPVRLFHWSFVAAFATCWYSGQTGDMELHYASGMVLVGLVIFRVLWGLVGSPTARFSHFLRWPHRAFAYLRDSFGNWRPSYSHGHNAAGGLMVAALIALVGLQTLSGMTSTDDVLFDGPLYGRLPDWLDRPLEKYHALLGNVLLGLAALHIVVIILYRLLKRENLVRAMIIGRARLPRSVARMAEQDGSAKSAPLWRALACAIMAAAVPAAIHLTLMS